MRDYQPKAEGKYSVERSVYKRAVAFLRDYPRLVRLRDQALAGECTDKKSGRSAPIRVPGCAVEDIQAVDRALDKIPAEYRAGVMENIIHGTAQGELYPPADPSTWRRWRTRLIYYVASNKHWL